MFDTVNKKSINISYTFYSHRKNKDQALEFESIFYLDTIQPLSLPSSKRIWYLLESFKGNTEKLLNCLLYQPLIAVEEFQPQFIESCRHPITVFQSG